MKILFFNPPYFYKKQRHFIFKECNGGLGLSFDYPKKDFPKLPTSDLLIGYTGAKRDHDVHLLDSHLHPEWHESEFISEILEINPKIIFLRSSWPSFYYDNQIIKKLKKRNPNIKVIGFGRVFNQDNNLNKLVCYDEIFKGNFINFDWSILSRNNNWADVNASSESKLNSKLSNLTTNHIAYYELNEYNENYITSSEGCSFKCKYCAYSYSNNNRVTNKSINSVIDELKIYSNKKIYNINFRDPSFNAQKNRLIRICNAIIDEGIKIKWSCEVILNLLNEEIISLMKSAGCFSVRFAVESLNKNGLRSLGRPVKFSDDLTMNKNIGLLNKYNIEMHAFFMIGIPGDTIESICYQANWSKRQNFSRIQFLGPNFYPGTPQFSFSLQEFTDKNLNLLNDLDFSFLTSTQSYTYFSMSKEISPKLLHITKNAVYNSIKNREELTPSWIRNNLDVPRYPYLSVNMKGSANFEE